MRYKTLLAILVILAVIQSCSNISVYHITKDTPLPKNGGFFFALPSTAFNIEISVRKTRYIPGPYAQFAGKNLNLSNVITEEKLEYQIEDVILSQNSVPDPDLYFYLELPAKSKESFSAEINELGILTSLNMSAPKSREQKTNRRTGSASNNKHDELKLEFLTNSLKEKIDTIIERIQVDSMVIEKKSYRTNLIDKSDQDFASEIADKIFNLRKFRMELISGELETPYPGASLTLMLAELDRMIEENLDLFTGTTEASIEKHHFAFTPGTTPEGIICGFSKIKGILPGGNPNGEDIVITLTLPENQSLKNFTTRCDSLVEIFNGIPYRIPFLSQIKISYLSQSLYETTIPVAQYGILTRMPLDKKYLKHISSENTGGIRFIGK